MGRCLSEDERVTRFASAAKRFCRLIEGRGKLKKRDFVRRSAAALAELQLLSLAMVAVRVRFVPYGDYGAHASAKRARLSVKRWKILYGSLRRKLGKDDGYFVVFNPYQPAKDEPYQSSLSDDLADIYNDLREGLDLYQDGDEKAVHDAVWVWRERWLILTGHHYVSALRALQVLVEKSYGIVQGD